MVYKLRMMRTTGNTMSSRNRIIGEMVIIGIMTLSLMHLLGYNSVSLPSSLHCKSGNGNAIQIDSGGAVSGSIFSGEKVRHWSEAPSTPQSPACESFLSDPVPDSTKDKYYRECKIPIVAVTTTISNSLPSIKMLHASKLTRNIPVVIAGDIKAPVGSKLESFFGHPLTTFHLKKFMKHPPTQGEIILLTVEDQNRLFPCVGDHTPIRHFGRKNMGYLAAVAMGACSVWDFDDDNYPSNLNFFSSKNIEEMRKTPLLTMSSPKSVAVNPYVLLGAQLNHSHTVHSSPIWPRGLPLTDKKLEEIPTLYASEFIQIEKETRTLTQVFETGVIQSLADNDPDVDAIYRLTSPLPVMFESPLGNVGVHPAQFSPFNGQATLWYNSSIWAAYLPVTVHGRVSDIWRGYIAQTLMRCAGLLLVFSPPAVIQYRNAHNYQGDLKAEQPLYLQTEAMVRALEQFQCTSRKDLGSCLDELYVNLYERDFVNAGDVLGVRAWIRTLRAIGYRFPLMSLSLCPASKPENIIKDVSIRAFALEKPNDLTHHVNKNGTSNDMLTKALVALTIREGQLRTIPVWISLYQDLAPPAVFYTSEKADRCRSMATTRVYCESSGGDTDEEREEEDWKAVSEYRYLSHAILMFPGHGTYISARGAMPWDHRVLHTAAISQASMVVEEKTDSRATRLPPKEWSFGDATNNAQLKLMIRSETKLQDLVTKHCPNGPPGNIFTKSANANPGSYFVSGSGSHDFQAVIQTFRKYSLPKLIALPWAMHCAVGPRGGILPVMATSDLFQTYVGLTPAPSLSMNKFLSWRNMWHKCQSVWKKLSTVRNGKPGSLKQSKTGFPTINLNDNGSILSAILLRDCLLKYYPVIQGRKG